MEEKKQTGKMSYSNAGKRFRGFLCMLTFCVCVASAVLSAYGIVRFGGQIIYTTDYDYFTSTTYQEDISDEIVTLLDQLKKVYVSGTGDTFSITDVEKRRRYEYSLQDVLDYYHYESVDTQFTNLDDLQEYVNEVQILDTDFYDYSKMVRYLISQYGEDTYLYFSDTAFKKLFYRGGRINTNHCYSSDFSESAYFLFEDNEAVDARLHSGVSIEQSVILQEGEEGSTEILTNIYTDSADSEDTNPQIDLEGLSYAVYDPEMDLFYSPEDDYFSPMHSYVYHAEEVASYEDSSEAGNADSIIFSLLKSMNYGVSEEFQNQLVSESDSAADALEYLKRLDNTGLLYYMENSEFQKSNVDQIDTICNQNYAYRLSGSKRTDTANWIDASLLDYYPLIEESFVSFPKDTVFYFGVDEDRYPSDTNLLIRNSRAYKFYAVGTKFFVVVAIVSLLLLIIQAVWMIRTTGKKEEGSKEVFLNRFDNLPTELWLIVYAAFFVWCWPAVVLTAKVVLSALRSTPFVNIGYIIIETILITLPFAFLFMMLTLSVVRRCRARKLWHNSFLRKWGPYLWNRVKVSYERQKGMDRLLVLFFLYEIVGGICVCVMHYAFLFDDTLRAVAFLIFIVLQLAAVGTILYLVRDVKDLIRGVERITGGELDHKVKVNEKLSMFKDLSYGINHIGDGLKVAIETSLKDERMKTELITNVSHDLKTPLTSIINYINLLKTEKMPTKEAEHYVSVLDAKALRLKQLTEDLVEAAKANTGNIELEKMPLAFDELMKQAIGEFEDKFVEGNLTIISDYPEETALILADGRRMFRIMENVLQNAYKYSLSGSRVYANLSKEQGTVTFTLKNISAVPLNISPDELMERFTRGDASRTTEGSGLGLSIAKDLTKLQEGTFDIVLDGDLFKVIITFPEYVKMVVPDAAR